ncbi:MAG TPA: DUF4328 domain-containing protein [Candidatus Limnocylindrales bacterium]|nr:DUF4328 domain-containing protein [Candidatus Limnocylindrales bacterium]
MTDIWVCANCKSINRLRDTRCYSCGQRQEEVAVVADETPNVRLSQAVANRAVRGYESSLPFAIAAGVLIVVVAAMGLWLLIESLRGMDILKDAFVQAVLSNDETALQPLLVEQQRLASPSALRLLLLLLAVLAFGLWLSRVRLNIPALGGGTPEWGPWKALLYPLIPIVNLFRVPAMVQDALYRLDPRGGGLGMVLLAWVGFVGSWIVGLIGGVIIAATFAGAAIGAQTPDALADAFGSLIDQSVILSIITEVMTAAGALVLVAVIARIESRGAARDAEIRASLDPLPVPDVAPVAGTPPPGPAVTMSQPFAQVDAPGRAADAAPMAPPPPPPR